MKILKSSYWIGLGMLIWLLILGQWFPFSVFSLTHVHALLLAAPLFLVPLAWSLLGFSNWFSLLGLISASLLALAFVLPQGIIAALCAMPWFLIGIYALIIAWKNTNKWTLQAFCLFMGFVYLLVAGVWSIAHCLDFQPLGFSSTITLLTAIHFHYAGFIVPVLASWLMEYYPHRWNKLMAVSVILGVPLVAIGLMASKFGITDWLEVVGVLVMASGGILVGVQHIRVAWKSSWQFYTIPWILAGIALIFGMNLALIYGIRSIFVVEWLSIPWMYAVHGTLNAVGFAIPALFGWALKFK